jgi:hypothetical protein
MGISQSRWINGTPLTHKSRSSKEGVNILKFGLTRNIFNFFTVKDLRSKTSSLQVEIMCRSSKAPSCGTSLSRNLQWDPPGKLMYSLLRYFRFMEVEGERCRKGTYPNERDSREWRERTCGKMIGQMIRSSWKSR